MYVKDFVYQLPKELIAQFPKTSRTQSRLLCLEGKMGELTHRSFSHFPDLLNPSDLLVLNDTRVIPARLFGHKLSGGKIEILVEKILNEKEVLAHVRSNKKLKLGTGIVLDEGNVVKIEGRSDNLFHLRFLTATVTEVLDSVGHIPLPPYLNRVDEVSDEERYQTVYAREKGAVAAPTAGLHFDQTMLSMLEKKGVELAFVTLHVGAGTFQPVRVENLAEHKMHSEWMRVSDTVCEQIKKTRKRGGRVIAVGTTSVRCLETAAIDGTLRPYEGETDLFIMPGSPFRVVDAMLTNFHLPASTLLMLVCAFAGRERILAAYEEAKDKGYRFYSYGDAMFLTRSK